MPCPCPCLHRYLCPWLCPCPSHPSASLPPVHPPPPPPALPLPLSASPPLSCRWSFCAGWRRWRCTPTRVATRRATPRHAPPRQCSRWAAKYSLRIRRRSLAFGRPNVTVRQPKSSLPLAARRRRAVSATTTTTGARPWPTWRPRAATTGNCMWTRWSTCRGAWCRHASHRRHRGRGARVRWSVEGRAPNDE